ncbi:ATP-binding protein [Actinoplanes xinjiangensis]|uniref:Anti-sigma regulatory factor (Ser/Thr protein kinase) n=1 Tax=Actinoplanes xinjiangensis TaxID=512350 RepID=A0A316EIU5_9ACTN|nr:ATP-binding protein [Actinoplanes xinjiangensis]PWK29890.1 anti-sigma regulatory factor (Ser/Thr protein kinase) [Actinoplanes xinjiangensis]
MEDRIGQSVRSALDGEPRVDAAPPREWPVLLDRTFGPDDIAVVRHEITRLLAAVGFAGDRQHGFVLAVNEVLTNVVLHAGGTGRVVLKIEDGSVWCVVTDSGPGIPGAYLDGLHTPEAFEVGGRGLWLAHHLCDEVTTATGPIGTSIGLRIIVDSAG